MPKSKKNKIIIMNFKEFAESRKSVRGFLDKPVPKELVDEIIDAGLKGNDQEIKKLKIIFNKESDEKDQLYGSISKKEIIDFFLDNNLKVKSDDILIKNQIKSIGDHLIVINPYDGITEEILITVSKN